MITREPQLTAIQGGADWLAARCGKVTASRLGDLIARTKTGWSASRANYMSQILVERLTGVPVQIPTTGPMRWGTENEPLALAAYTFRTDQDVSPVGFISHPAIGMSGASPDGLVETDGLVEIKCPTTSTHIETLAARTAPAKYLPQMQWQMACTGRAWCDFVSFDPRLPEALRLFSQRMARDEEVIAELEAMVLVFLAEVDERLAELNGPVRLRAVA